MTIKLTDAERLILSNQHQILSYLDKENNAWHLRVADNLRHGHAPLYRNMLDTLQPELDQETTHFVFEILGLYQTLRDSYNRLENDGTIDDKQLVWPGFDGNHEPELLTFTRALVEDERYVELLGESPANSHSPSKAMYGRMLMAWRKLACPASPLTREQIKEILSAQYIGGM